MRLLKLPGPTFFVLGIQGQGTRGRQHSDEYVRATVTLATVLLLIAISQRFKTRGVRFGLLAIAIFLLCFPVYRILTLPRA
jgi:Ca2+/Na+ antiporter